MTFRPDNHPLLSVDACPKCGKHEVSLPAYPGDYFDCDACGESWEPTDAQKGAMTTQGYPPVARVLRHMVKPEKRSEYELQADKWAERFGVTMSAAFVGHYKHFEGETETRDVYRILLTREGYRPVGFDFGQSLNKSGYAEAVSQGRYWDEMRRKWRRAGRSASGDECKRTPPTLYDVLTSLEKDYSESFEEWCSNFGADTDSMKARRTYDACQDQARAFVRLCGGEGVALEAARKIQ